MHVLDLPKLTTSLQSSLTKSSLFTSRYVSKRKSDVFIALVLISTRWNLLMFICYLCNFLYLTLELRSVERGIAP